MPRPKPLPHLSKTRSMAGLQCHKRLWLALFQPEAAAEVDAVTQARFDEGTRVGEIARGWVPGGTLVEESREELAAALRRTQALLAEKSVPALYEATLSHDQVLVRADILRRNRGGSFDLLEVKSSTGAKPEHLWDVAVQAYVLRGAGLKLRRMGLLHIDNSYVYPGGEHDPQGLFALADLTADVEAALPDVPGLLASMRAALRSGTPPAIAPGDQCHAPYECPFTAECIPPAPPHAVGELYRSTPKLRERLAADGITMITEIPDGFALSDLQQRQRDAVVAGQAWRHDDLRAVLSGLERPLSFLDFETFNPAVPLYSGTRPYQQIPFQWSVHRMDTAGGTTHAEYLHEGGGDPRPALARALIAALGDKGPICVYSHFERTQLQAMQEALPPHARALARIEERLVDLLPLVRNHVYHPDFHGSFSIKSVLPALVPGMGYEGLEITDGTSASVAYWGLVTGALPESERVQVRQDLLAYCGRDTEALVRLYRELVG